MWLKFLLFLLWFNFQQCLERIQRKHSRVINANIGDTIKLEWKYTVPKDALVLFNCGYRNEALNPSSTKDPPLVTLALTQKVKEFMITKKASSDLQSTLRATDSLELKNLASAHRDTINEACVLQLQNIPVEIESASLQCKLTWKVNNKNEYMHGGETQVKIKDNSGSSSPQSSQSSTPCAGSKSSSRVRGEIFLGAILFDLLLVVFMMSASLILSRRREGYEAPKKQTNKLTKKSKQKRDVEKGGKSEKKTKSKNDGKKQEKKKSTSEDKKKKSSSDKSSKRERGSSGKSGERKEGVRSERSKTESSKQAGVPKESSRSSSGRGRERKGGTSGGGSKRRSERSESSRRK
ncbi:serine/arginine-rich splicing factor 4-like [Clytia hemisphaerica]